MWLLSLKYDKFNQPTIFLIVLTFNEFILLHVASGYSIAEHMSICFIFQYIPQLKPDVSSYRCRVKCIQLYVR